jgi:hypothetical protein
MTICEILENLCISVFSIFLALLYAKSGRSRLFINLKPPKKIAFGNEKSIFVNLIVKNNPHKGWPLIPRETAYSCHGDVTFYNENGTIKICGPMPIRWSGNPQPIKYEVANDQIISLVEPSLIKQSEYIDIPRDEEEELDIAVRFYQENEAYGWNSESYFHENRNQKFRLPTGNYIIIVNLTCSSNNVSKKFILENPKKIEEFRIVEYKK